MVLASPFTTPIRKKVKRPPDYYHGLIPDVPSPVSTKFLTLLFGWSGQPTGPGLRAFFPTAPSPIQARLQDHFDANII